MDSVCPPAVAAKAIAGKTNNNTRKNTAKKTARREAMFSSFGLD
jgi:aconitase A